MTWTKWFSQNKGQLFLLPCLYLFFQMRGLSLVCHRRSRQAARPLLKGLRGRECCGLWGSRTQMSWGPRRWGPGLPSGGCVQTLDAWCRMGLRLVKASIVWSSGSCCLCQHASFLILSFVFKFLQGVR